MTMTKSNQARRRLQVRLSVLAGSAVTLAASWLGVVYADATQAARSESADAPLASSASAVTGADMASSAPRTTESGSTLVPVPTPARQTVIVRRSRAS
jgi:hypothetical protein